MQTLQNDLLLRTARGEETERVPVWTMRQAGRILPEYRELRAKLSGFIELVTTPHLAAEVTIQPVDRLGVDAAIIFSDILVIPEAMGLPYEMIEKVGPRFPQTIQTESDIKKMSTDGIEEKLRYVTDAISITKKELNGRVPLIGFAGAPFTIFCYMIEGKGSKTFSKPRALLYENPKLAHQLLQKITDATIIYLKAQIKAGADIIQVFDSWAGVLGLEQYREFSLNYIEQIVNAITEVPTIVFAKDQHAVRADFGKLNCNVIGLDWTMPIEESRKLIGNDKVLQGNLDPCVLYGSYEDIERETKKMLTSFAQNGHGKHIANLGHGVYPDLDFNKVKHFIDTVKAWKY